MTIELVGSGGASSYDVRASAGRPITWSALPRRECPLYHVASIAITRSASSTALLSNATRFSSDFASSRAASVSAAARFE